MYFIIASMIKWQVFNGITFLLVLVEYNFSYEELFTEWKDILQSKAVKSASFRSNCNPRGQKKTSHLSDVWYRSPKRKYPILKIDSGL